MTRVLDGSADARPGATDAPAATPRRRGALVGLSVLVGLLITSAWSAPFVDEVVGYHLAGVVLGHAPGTAVTGGAAGLVFAFAAGFAGTFTACNIAAFSALAPMAAGRRSTGSRLAAALRPVGWVAVGALPVAGLYGAIGAMVGTDLPQLSAATVGDVPVRLVPAMVVYGVIGVVFLWMGLAALHCVPDPFGGLTARFAPTPMVVVGVLIGLFLVGRPYPLFREMFVFAAQTGNPFWGAVSFLLVVIGNVALVAVLFVVVVLLGGDRLSRRLHSGASRVAAVTGFGLLVAGVFSLAYWDVRLPASYGYGWFPTMPWV